MFYRMMNYFRIKVIVHLSQSHATSNQDVFIFGNKSFFSSSAALSLAIHTNKRHFYEFKSKFYLITYIHLWKSLSLSLVFLSANLVTHVHAILAETKFKLNTIMCLLWQLRWKISTNFSLSLHCCSISIDM